MIALKDQYDRIVDPLIHQVTTLMQYMSQKPRH